MRVHVCAVGRLRTGPERDLTDDYLTRFDRAGRQLGLGPATLHEVETRKGAGMAAEAVLLGRTLPARGRVVVMDERGQQMTSPAFAALLATQRDAGCGDLAFVIGGAEGIAPDLRTRADIRLSFGRMVWPHLLARAMLAEQLYRAAAILAGSPYHRA